MSELWQLKTKIQSIDGQLATAVADAKRMGLTGTAYEIDSARSRLDSVLFEIDRKVEPEFAPYREPPPRSPQSGEPI